MVIHAAPKVVYSHVVAFPDISRMEGSRRPDSLMNCCLLDLNEQVKREGNDLRKYQPIFLQYTDMETHSWTLVF